MVVLDATIVNVALPHIQQALGFSDSGLEWVVNVYAVTFGGLLLLGGRGGDILGRRWVFVAGLLLFSAASLVGGFATSQWWLLTARAVGRWRRGDRADRAGADHHELSPRRGTQPGV
jgi:MFS family permease